MWRLSPALHDDLRRSQVETPEDHHRCTTGAAPAGKDIEMACQFAYQEHLEMVDEHSDEQAEMFIVNHRTLNLSMRSGELSFAPHC